jgi:hypothetical protein
VLLWKELLFDNRRFILSLHKDNMLKIYDQSRHTTSKAGAREMHTAGKKKMKLKNKYTGRNHKYHDFSDR